MSVSAETFRETLSFLPGGVTVVTAREPDGSPAGLTATAVCSVSLRPPLVLVCVEDGSSTRSAIAREKSFAVNLLDEDQAPLARRFAGGRTDKFDGVPWATAETGAPVLEAAVGYVDCRVERRMSDAGDHEIYIGEVRAAEIFRPGARNPLVYYLGEYRALRNVASTSPFTRSAESAGSDESGR